MLKYVVSILMYLSLSVLIGGTLFFGAGVAAVLFEPGLLPSRTLAGAVNSAVLHRLGLFSLGSCVVLALGAVYIAWRYGQWMNWIVLGLSVAMVIAVAYTSWILFPRMDTLRTSIGSFDPVPVEKAELHQQFQEGHVLYSNIMRGVLLSGVVVLMLHTAGLVRHAERVERRHRAAVDVRTDAPAESGTERPSH